MKQKSALVSVWVSLLTIALLGGCAETKLVANTAKMATQPDAPTTQPYKIGKPYQVDGAWYYPKADYDYDETGIASWYGPGFHGGNTANGEVYDENALTAAHKTLPMPSLVRVTNLENGRSIVVRINDRGPFVNNRVIDMTRRGAQLLGFDLNGTAKVRVQVLKEESMLLAAKASQQGGDNVSPAPKASPAGTVASQALPPAGQTASGAATPATAPASSSSVGSSAASTPAAKPPSAIQSKAGPITSPQPTAAASTSVNAAPLPQPQTAPAAVPSATQTASAPAATAPQPSKVTQGPVPTAPVTATASAATPPAPKPATTTAPAKTSSVGTTELPAPDGKVTVEPVKGNSNIYIQAGAFLRQNNAQQLSSKLSALGTSKITQVKLGQQTFYRVRLGPIASVEKADEILQQVIDDGNPEARIILE